jgi:Putative prokaryotic signal transducing protein
MKWVNVAMAPDQLTAEMWCELLRNEGIPAMVRASDAVSFLGVSPKAARVMVAEDRRDDAVGVLQREMGQTVKIEPP